MDAGQTKITILLFTSFYLTKDSTGVDLASQNWTELAGFCDFVSDDLGVLSLIQKPCGGETSSSSSRIVSSSGFAIVDLNLAKVFPK